jgi:hypothetical protein
MAERNEFLEKIIAATSIGDLVELDVPEWGAPIYFKKLNLQDRGLITKNATDNFDGAARTLVHAARDKDGNRLFSLADLKTIKLKLDAEVVLRVAGDIINHSLKKVEAISDDLGE